MIAFVVGAKLEQRLRARGLSEPAVAREYEKQFRLRVLRTVIEREKLAVMENETAEGSKRPSGPAEHGNHWPSRDVTDMH